MPRETEQQLAMQVPGILDFARAFRAASRAVGFYPPAHPATVSSLEALLLASRPLTEQGSLCLTILPDTFLVGGIPIDGSERLVADMSMTLHRHGIGALNLNSGATVDSWRSLLSLLAKPPEDVRAAGGVQRQWRALRHHGPGVLEIDFGELLLGHVGGDYSELAAVIGHYLDTAGVGLSLANDVLATLTRALERAPDEEHAVEALVRGLRTAVHLVRVLQPERFDEVLSRAATLASRLTEGVMTGLLAARGTTPAMLGQVDVVGAFLDRIPDDSAAKFLASAIVSAGRASGRLTEALNQIVTDPERRHGITRAAQQAVARDVAFESDFLARWAKIEQQLESYSDRRFMPDTYARELTSARRRSVSLRRTFDDPDDRIAAWADSVGDGALRSLDLSLLTDLARLESDAFRWRDVLAILRGHIFDAAEAGDWEGVAVAAEAIARTAADVADGLRSSPAAEVLQECARNWVAEEAAARLVEGGVAEAGPCARVLKALGPACIPRLVHQWSGVSDPEDRRRVEAVVVGLGRPGRDALLRLLAADDIDVRCATIRLLLHAGGAEHLPALEALLTDPHARVQREALEALAAAPSDQGRELAARGIGRAGVAGMPALVDLLLSLGPERAVPVLRHLVRQIDLGRAPMPVVQAVIGGLQRGRTALAADGLARVFETPLWRAPLRILRIRSAARHALHAMGGPAADALRAVSLVGGRR